MASVINRAVVFTIATNGYGDIFADWIASQREYALRNGYDYFALTVSPPHGISSANSAWLKIPMILRLLKRGYSPVMFLDADCRVSPRCPRLDAALQPGKSLYFACDWTARINTGVILAVQDPRTIRFFQSAHSLSDLPNFLIPKQDRNLYENGHLIFLSRRNPAVGVLDQRWNDYTGEMDEYVLHGHGRWFDKPRSQIRQSPSMPSLLWNRISQGPRYFLLNHLADFYMETYAL